MSYDVIIAGASFGGLAVAARLRGRKVLLLDRKPIGTGQTSACATLLSTLRSLRLEGAIQETHDRIVIHTPRFTYVYALPEPFCTFDYGELCRLLRQQGDAEFLQAEAQAADGDNVVTAQGTFQARLIVDASGWGAALAKFRRKGLVRRDRMSFGLETVAPCSGRGLLFWIHSPGDPPMTIRWLFPAGGAARIGVGSYRGQSRLGPSLKDFARELCVPEGRPHGGFFPWQLRRPSIGRIFLVGDAAGQCLGLTGEGIRPALFFGVRLGGLLSGVLDGTVSEGQARRMYEKLVASRRRGYEALGLAQTVLPRLPQALLGGLMALVARPAVLRRVVRRYASAFALSGDEETGPSA